MAVIGAVVGAGAVFGIATSDPYSDHYDHSEYDNYDNYSDAAERRRRRREAKLSEINDLSLDINEYKSESVNDYLRSQSLINQSGVEVSVDRVKEDGDQKLQLNEDEAVRNESRDLNKDLEEIDLLIGKINKVLEEK